MSEKPKRHPAVTALLWAGVAFFVLLFGCLAYVSRDAMKAGFYGGWAASGQPGGPRIELQSQGQAGRAGSRQGPQ